MTLTITDLFDEKQSSDYALFSIIFRNELQSYTKISIYRCFALINRNVEHLALPDVCL